MQANKTERLLNLVIALLATRRALTIAEIRSKVAGYDSPSDEAFQRMFERDKAELRELGVPLETVTIDPWTEELGYQIRRADYELPEIVLTGEEAAAVGLAVRFWRSDEVSAAVSSALRKLRAAGVEVGEPLPQGLEPVVDAGDPSLLTWWDAVRDRRPVRFDYLGAAAGAAATRLVEPWGVTSWHGHWYVAGFDRDRAAPRVFRLDRVRGEVKPLDEAFTTSVPADVDVAAMVSSATPEVGGAARVRVRAGRAHEVRRAASSLRSSGEWDEAEVPYGDLGRAASWLAGFGADVVVLDPAPLRATVIGLLQGAVSA